MLDAVGIPRTALTSPDLRISNAAGRELLELSARAAEDFGLRLSDMRSPSVMGPVALIAREQPTVRGVVHAIARHIGLHNDLLTYRLEDFADISIIHVGLRSPSTGPARQSWDLTLAMLVKTLRLYLGAEWRPQSVSFMHGPPRSTDTYRRIFRARVDFDQDFNGLVCARADLDRSNDIADPHMAREVERYLRTLGRAPSMTLRDRVREFVEAMLSTGHCNVQFVAQQLGKDVRTLQRQLAHEGASFLVIVQEVRKSLANQYVAESDRPLSDVAELLGFSALSAFSRWHQTQYGLSPTSRRDAMRTTADAS